MACDRRRAGGATVLAIALLGSLVCNYTPAITAVLLIVATAVAAIELIRGRSVPREALHLILPFGYWALSFLFTGESWGTFFSPEFQRRDGAMYASMLPIAVLALLPIDRERLRSAILVYLILQAAIAAAGGLSVLGGWISPIYKPADVVDAKLTFFGFYVTHNAAASVYCLLAIGALVWALRKDLETRHRALLLSVAVLLTLGTVLARSRGVFLALIAASALVIFRAIRHGLSKRIVTGAVVGLIVAVLAGGVLLFPRFARMTEPGADHFRKGLWTRAWEDFKRSPIIGVGFGRFNDEDREFEEKGIVLVAKRARAVNNDAHAHNSYLQWLAEGGMLGLAVMAAFWTLVARRLDARDDVMRDWILAGILAMAVMCLTEHYAGGGIFLTHLAFLIGLQASAREEPLL